MLLLQGSEPNTAALPKAATQDRMPPGQEDFAAEMRAKAQAKRKAAAPDAVPVSTALGFLCAPWSALDCALATLAPELYTVLSTAALCTPCTIYSSMIRVLSPLQYSLAVGLHDACL